MSSWGEFIQVGKSNLQIALGSFDLLSRIKISVRGQWLENWKGLTLKYDIDSPCAAMSFTTVFNPDDDDSRELFQPMSRRVVDITIDGTTVFQGTLDIITPSKSNNGIQVNVQGRSLVSNIVDSDLVGDVYFKNLTLQQFANKIAGSNVCKFEPDSTPIPVIKVEKGEKIYEAIAKEAGSRGYWCVPSISRPCYFVKISSSDEVQCELEEGFDPVISVNSSFDLTKRFTEYTIIGGGNGSSRSVLVEDDSLQGFSNFNIIRSKIVKANKENTNLKLFGERARNQDQVDSISIGVNLSSWFFNDKLWQPGAMIQLEAPSVMIYNPSKFVIKSVTLTYDEDGEKAELGLALPNAFDGSTITDKPWILKDTTIYRGLLPRIKAIAKGITA